MTEPTPDDRTPEEKLAELERLNRDLDERDRQQDAEALTAHLDSYLEPEADAIATGITRLAVMLAELELIGEDDRGTVLVSPPGTELVYAIEADHPDGKRLYSLDGVDTVVATRLREDGRYEHAVLDEGGLPIEWRPAHRPDLN